MGSLLTPSSTRGRPLNGYRASSSSARLSPRLKFMNLSQMKLPNTVVKSGRLLALQAAPREQKVTFGTPFSTGGNLSLGTRLPRTGSGHPAEATPTTNSSITTISNSANSRDQATPIEQQAAAATTWATAATPEVRGMPVGTIETPTATITGTAAAKAATTAADTTTGTGGTRGDRPRRPSTFVFVPSPSLPPALRHPQLLPRPPSPTSNLSLSVSQ